VIFTDEIIKSLDKIVTSYGWELNKSNGKKVVWAEKTIRDLPSRSWISISIDFHALDDGYKVGHNWSAAKGIDTETSKQFTDALIKSEKIIERSKAILG